MLLIYEALQAVFLSIIILFGSLSNTGGLSIGVAMPDPGAGALGSYVNPFIGTGGLPWTTGMLWPGATVPHGTVKLSPTTCYIGGLDPFPSNGYYYGQGHINGFAHTVLEGGHFKVTPAVGDTDPADRLKKPLPYRHSREIAAPGYYAVYLPSIACMAEMTATSRVGVHRYTFDTSKDAHIFIDATGFLRDGGASGGKITVNPDTMEITGEACVSASFAKRYGGMPGYFAARLDRPFESYDIWDSGDGTDVGVNLNFGDMKNKPIELQIGISFVSLANARENLEAEADGLDFDAIRGLARDAWEAQLSKIKIATDDEKIKTIFYTGLYHSMTKPVDLTDVNGDYLGFGKQARSTNGEFTYYTDMSLWDTFRTVHPLYTLIAPEVQLDCVKSLIEMARAGGSLPRWPSGAGYTGSMFGSPADMMIAETYLKGITDFDVEAAYGFMKATSDGLTGPNCDNRRNIEEYNRLGYVPADVDNKGWVSQTLEYAWADGSIALLGEALGKDAAEVQIYKDKSMYYKNLFDPGTKYFRAKNSDGSWVKPFSPYVTEFHAEVLFFFPKPYAEGGAQHYRWSVPQDPQGLIELFGSKEHFVRELDKFMGSASRKMGAIDPGAGWWVGNQHNMHAPYMFNEAGRPDLAQKWARWTLMERFGTGPDGLDGNDDAGTLSAWYVLSALGLYPVAGSDRWWLGAPIVDSAVLSLGEGKTLTVTANNQSARNKYVQGVTLNGEKLTEPWVLHGELTANAANMLVFEMGPNPAVGGGY